MNAATLKSDDAVRILNMVYSVFLAIIGRFAIQQIGGGGDVRPLEVHFLISESNWIPVLFLTFYFIFDWLSTNITLPMKASMTHMLLPVMITGIVVLGGLVAFAFVPSHLWYFLFGVYAAITPWYDIIATKSADEEAHGLKNCIIIYGMISLRVATGLIILCLAGFRLWLHPDGHVQPADGWLLFWLGVYVGLKMARYFVFIPLNQKDKSS